MSNEQKDWEEGLKDESKEELSQKNILIRDKEKKMEED